MLPFESAPLPKKPSAIALELAGAFGELQKAWFNHCVELLQEFNRYKAKVEEEPDFEILRPDCGGEASAAMNAFQGLLASGMVSGRGYANNQEQDFIDALTATMWKGDFENCLSIFDELAELESDRKAQTLRFAEHVGAHITGNPKSRTERSFIASQTQSFVLQTFRLVAEAFGDGEMAESLKERKQAEEEKIKLEGRLVSFGGVDFEKCFIRAVDADGQRISLVEVSQDGTFTLKSPVEIPAIIVEKWGRYRFRIFGPWKSSANIEIQLKEVKGFALEGVTKTENLAYLESSVITFFDENNQRMDSARSNDEGFFGFETNIPVCRICAENGKLKTEIKGRWDKPTRFDLQLI